MFGIRTKRFHKLTNHMKSIPLSPLSFGLNICYLQDEGRGHTGLSISQVCDACSSYKAEPDRNAIQQSLYAGLLFLALDRKKVLCVRCNDDSKIFVIWCSHGDREFAE